jgi:hypothetical protein
MNSLRTTTSFHYDSTRRVTALTKSGIMQWIIKELPGNRSAAQVGKQRVLTLRSNRFVIVMEGTNQGPIYTTISLFSIAPVTQWKTTLKRVYAFSVVANGFYGNSC